MHIEYETMIDDERNDGKECKAVVYGDAPGKIYELNRARVAGPV